MSLPVDSSFPSTIGPSSFDGMPDVAFLDAQGVVRQASAQFAEVFGSTPADIIGKDFAGLFHEDSRLVVRRKCRLLLAMEDGGFSVDALVRRYAGDRTRVRISVFGFRGVLVAGVRPAQLHSLSELDARILEAVARGETAVRIAARIFLSKQGVNYHISALLRRFKVVNRAALVSKAYHAGVLDARSWPPRVADMS
jgi:PAS domain S-box-containing protein